MVNHGIELFTLSKDQFNLYFDTLFRLRPEVKIDLFPEKKHVYVRSVNQEKIQAIQVGMKAFFDLERITFREPACPPRNQKSEEKSNE